LSEQSPLQQSLPPPPRRAIPVLYQGHARLTWALLGVMLLIFGVEEFLGGSEIGPVLVRLGANLPAEPLLPHLWRLISSIFLHIGWLHLLANGVVLLFLGRFFEKLVGSQRFFLLFILSGLAGSWASATFSGADLSAGASGGLWGLLGACLALSIFPGPVFPVPWVKSFRKNTIFNLGINLYFSTLANIDFAAHLGGGLMGLMLYASGFLTRGLPVQPQYPVPRLIQQNLTRVFFLSLLTTLTALIIPWAQQKPQELVGEIPLKGFLLNLDNPKQHTSFQLAIEAPEFLSLNKQEAPNAQSLRFVLGDLKSDPVMLILSWTPFTKTLANAIEQKTAADEILAKRKKQPLPEQVSIDADFSWIENTISPAWHRRLKWDNGITQNVYSQIQNNALIDLQILYYDAFDPTYHPLGNTILNTLELVPQGQQP
jgi:membrane associated rhomboid family serine protease